MNRYRTLPGSGPQKATTTTTCQKCLKKDNYECKAGAQDRPYISRPSRTQQLLNPQLKPRLTSDTPNELLRKDGIADEQLARAEAGRNVAERRRSRSPEAADVGRIIRERSLSASSFDSVSTISTNRSRSASPRTTHASRQLQDSPRKSSSHGISTKRKHRDLSVSSTSKSPPRSDRHDSHKSRRYGSINPDDRGRPMSDRRGSHRSRSTSDSYDRSEVTRHRRSLDPVPARRDDGINGHKRHERQSGRYSDRQHDSKLGGTAEKTSRSSLQRQRSLSPFSKRLALTQAMNMGH